MRGTISKRCGCPEDRWPRCGHSWSLKVSAGSGPDGKRKQKRRVVKGSRRDAERALTRLLQEIDEGKVADAGRATVATYLTSTWLPNARTRVREKVANRYEELIRLHVVPRIGAVPLSKLRSAHVQSVVDGMVTAGKAPRTILQAYVVMKSAFGHAVRLQLIAVNPADPVRPPRPERPKLSVPDWTTVRTILDATEGTDHHIQLVLLATTGMRRGEALALQWSNCDLDAGVIRVTRAAQQVGQVVSFNDPKSDRGRRSIDLPASTVALLRQHRKDQLERRMLAGPEWQDNDLIVDNGLSAPVRPWWIAWACTAYDSTTYAMLTPQSYCGPGST
jgi:integrase